MKRIGFLRPPREAKLKRRHEQAERPQKPVPWWAQALRQFGVQQSLPRQPPRGRLIRNRGHRVNVVEPAVYARRNVVKASFSRNRWSGGWAANARYLAWSGARQEFGKGLSFEAERGDIELRKTVRGWEREYDIRLLLSQILHRLTEHFNERAVTGYRHRLSLTVVEFPRFGRLDVFAESLALVAGHGIKACLIAQDLSQIHAAYTGGRALAVANNDRAVRGEMLDQSQQETKPPVTTKRAKARGSESPSDPRPRSLLQAAHETDADDAPTKAEPQERLL